MFRFRLAQICVWRRNFPELGDAFTTRNRGAAVSGLTQMCYPFSRRRRPRPTSIQDLDAVITQLRLG